MNNVIGAAIGHGARSNVTINNKYDGPPPLAPEEAARLLADYRARMLEDTRYVNLRGIPLPRGRLDVPLDKVYIRLQAVEEKQRREQDDAEERALQDRVRRDSERDGPKDNLAALRALGEFFYRRGEVIEAEKRPEPVDPQEALTKHKRLVVLGAPGAGKSTLLRYLARRAAEETHGPIPIPVSLRDFAIDLKNNPKLTLHEFALRGAAGDEQQYPTLHQALKVEIAAGRVLWLADALDEARDDLTGKIAKDVNLLPGLLILTSRPMGYNPMGTGLQGLPHFEVLPLQAEEVEKFLQSWFELLAGQRQADADWIKTRADWLKQQLEARPRLKPLTRNPLMLTFLAILAGEDQQRELPDQRAQLYRRYIEELLTSREIGRPVRQGLSGEPVFNLSPQVALDTFHYLGWAIHLTYYGGKPQEAPTKKALARSLTGYLRENLGENAQAAAQAALDFWQEAGLLETWHIDGQDYLTFRHLTFQEYAAAWGLAESWKRNPKRAWAFLKPRLHHYAWREPILLLVGLLEQKHLDDLAVRLLRGPSAYEKHLHRDLLLAGELLAEGAALAQEQNILRRLSRLQSSWIYEIIFTLFARIGVRAIPILIQALQKSLVQLLLSKDVRYYATKALAQVGAQAAPALIRVLQHGDENVRKDAAQALGEIGDPQAVPVLIQAMQDRDRFVRMHAAIALGEIGDTQAVPVLIQALQDRDQYVRMDAARALGEIGDPQAVPVLIQALQDKDGFVRMHAATALQMIGDTQAVPVLIQALQDRDQYVRRHAAEVLGKLGDAQTVPALIQALQDDDKDVRREAAQALGWIGDARAVPTMIDTLQDNNYYVRRDAAEVLGKLGDTRAVPALIQALRDGGIEDVRSHVAQALVKLGDAQAVPALIQVLHDDDEDVRRWATNALGKIGDPRAAPTLLQTLQDDRVEIVRDSAVMALGKIGSPQAVPALIQVLQQDSYGSISAATALGEIGDPRAVSVLLQALRDGEKWMRDSAVMALGEIGDPRALPALIQALWDSDRDVRWLAAQAVGKCAKTLDNLKMARLAVSMLERRSWLVYRLVERILSSEELTHLTMLELRTFLSFDQIANRLTILEVQALPFNDPLLQEAKLAKQEKGQS